MKLMTLEVIPQALSSLVVGVVREQQLGSRSCGQPPPRSGSGGGGWKYLIILEIPSNVL